MLSVELWCDGACRGNNSLTSKRLGGFGGILICGENKKEFYGYAINTTNNEMELSALLNGLKYLKRHDINLKIYTDSQYTIDGATKWCIKWRRNNWEEGKKAKIKNLGLWFEITRLLDSIGYYGKYEFIKVKGHSGVALNERADELANIAMNTRSNCV